jgi:hypothetical protein
MKDRQGGYPGYDRLPSKVIEPNDPCTCPDCITEDFRSIDEMCTHPDCQWGTIDPHCPLHGTPQESS